VRRFITVIVLAGTAAACQGIGSEPPPSTPPAFPSEASPSGGSPTPPALPSTPPPKEGLASPTCAHGWVTPASDTPRSTDPLGLVRRSSPVEGPLEVVEMRYFVGPESPPSEQGYLKDIERWYIKLYAVDDPAYQGRFLVEQRRFGRGVVAVAPYDTSGFVAPDWSGFQWSAADPARRAYPTLPGTWRGVRYDFVNGGEGLTIPGLPDAVVGCLDGS
jgi:hypothetical protein